MIVRARLLLFAAVGGGLTGLISFAFLRSLDLATDTRIANGWLVWLLPAVGLLVGATYHYLGGRAKGGTPAVIEQGTSSLTACLPGWRRWSLAVRLRATSLAPL